MPLMLYTHERAGAGVASIPLRLVNHAVRLKLTRGGRVEEYELKRYGKAIFPPGSPDGEPKISVQIEEPGRPSREYSLADWPKAVAVTVSDMLFWLEDGRWRLDLDHKAIEAHSLVEERCYPDGHDLPDNRLPFRHRLTPLTT